MYARLLSMSGVEARVSQWSPHHCAIAFTVACGQNVRKYGAQRPPWAAHLRYSIDWARFLRPIGGPMNGHDFAGDFGSRREPVSSEPLPNEKDEESRKIRRLQIMISMVMSVIGQDPNLTVEEAAELAAGAKRAALAMFPDKELAFDILYKPRLQRLMNERFRMQ